MAGIKDKFKEWIWWAVLAFLIYAFIEGAIIHGNGDWDYGSPPTPEFDPD